MKNNLVKKFLSFSIGGYINALLSLLIVPITTRMLSVEQYGIASLVTTVVNFMFVFCCLGTEQGFVRFFYEEDEENRGNLLYNCLYYPFFISILAFVIVYFFRYKLSFFFLEKYDPYFWLIFIGLILFTSLNRYSLIVVRMKQKGKLFSFLNVLSKINEFIFILMFYNFFGQNYKTLVLAILVSLIINTLISIISEKDIWEFSGISKHTKQSILLYSYPLTFTMVLNWIFGSADKMMLKSLADIMELGLYSGAFKIIGILSVISAGFTSFWTPVAHEHYEKNKDDLYFFKKTNDYLSLLFFLLGLGVLMFRRVIVLLLSNQYAPAIYIMPMLIFIPVMYLLSETTFLGISFMKKTKYSLYISIIISICNVLGNYILIPYLGARGAAISTGLSYILYFTLRTYFSLKLMPFGFNLKRIYFIVSILLIHCLYLTFNGNVFYDLISGMIIGIILIILYKKELKEMYSKYKKKEAMT